MTTNNSSNNKTAASGKVLQGQGVGTASDFSTATYPAIATGTGTILRADGTNWAATTTTYPNTNAINTVLYASSANVMAALPTANSAVLATNGSGVPSITATPTITSVTFGSGTALSQYVEGTFNPTFNGSTGTPSPLTYSTQVGTYTRIGNRVTVNIFLVLTARTGGSGNALLQTLPFTSQSTSLNYSSGACFMDQVTLVANTGYVATVINNTTNVQIISFTTAAFSSPLLVGAVPANGQFSLTVTYQV